MTTTETTETPQAPAAVQVHPFTRQEGAAAWICTCGRSRNSSAHKGQAAKRASREPRAIIKVTPGTVPACQVEPGTLVLTTDEVGTDFGLPLVEPTKRRGGFSREVRSHIRESGGVVVRFTDGTKTRPLNGHTALILADAPDEEGGASEAS